MIAHGAALAIAMGFSTYSPAHLHVVAGDTVTWRNDSARTHSVTARDGSFDSGDLGPRTTFARRVEAPGVLPYFCRKHAGMTGEIVAVTALLDHPAGAGRPGTPRTLTGRTSLPAGTELTLEADTGTGFAPAGTVVAGRDGALRLQVAPRVPTSYRVVGAGDASPPVRAEVLDRRVTLRSVRRRARRLVVEAAVTPAAHGTPAVLQLRLPERFGWWPVARARVDHHSRVRFRVPLRRRVPARVVLTLPDGATVVAASAVARR